MSCSYAEGLSKYENKGKLGLPERFDPPDEVARKVQILAQWMRESKHTVIHTGAGISTAAGIPDFRGPNGVWTLEKEGLKPEVNISWDDARPTLTHMAIVSLEQRGYVQYVVTQNIDGLHLRSGLQRKKLAELHGDMFVDKCNLCQRQFVRSSAATTVGQKSEGKSCPARRSNGRRCRGKLHDNILDWEDGLPDADLDLAISNACIADLSLCLGTTLQIVPSGNIPVDTKKRGGKLAICNLQPTKQDRHADLIINTYVDDLMKRLLELLGVPLLDYSPKDDPLKITQLLLQNSRVIGRSDEDEFEPLEWTIPEEWVKDKDLVERVKARKVIRKRPGVKEEVVQRKKVKNNQIPVTEEEMKDEKVEDKVGVCHRNGEALAKTEEEEKGVKLETGSLKKEEAVKIEKQEAVNSENDTNAIKKEEAMKSETEAVKSAQEGEAVKMENQEVTSVENLSDAIIGVGGHAVQTQNKVSEKEEEEKAENGVPYSNGNSEDEKVGNDKIDISTEDEIKEEKEEVTELNKIYNNKNVEDEDSGTEIEEAKEKEDDEKTAQRETYDNRNTEEEKVKNNEGERTDIYSNGNLDYEARKEESEGEDLGVLEGHQSRSPGEENDLTT